MTDAPRREQTEPDPPDEQAPTVVRIPREIADIVARLARESGHTPSAVIAWAVLAAIGRGEVPPPARVERVQCADPTCRAWFTRPTSGPGSTQRYHTRACSQRTREREAKRRSRAK